MTYYEPGLFPNEESSQEDFLAKTSALLGNVLDLPEGAQVCSGKSAGSLTISIANTSFLKMSPVCCHQTEDETWEPLSGRWLSSGMGSLTEFWTLKTSESPNVAVECSLSDVLETQGPHLQKYLLSAKACSGILRRASRRDKKLPERLEQALRTVMDKPDLPNTASE